MELKGKLALVTGGTDGIGARLIRHLREGGANIITTGLDPARIAATRADGFEVIAADLSTPEGVAAVVAGVAGRPLAILINNAGMGDGNHDFRLGAPDVGQATRAIALNLAAPMQLIAALMPTLREQGASGGAMIVNVTSGLAIAPRAGGPVYCATKAGLRSYTQAIRAQLKGTGIHVCEALPPVVETRMTAGRSNRKMPPDECAAQIVMAMRRDADEANIGLVRALRLAYSLSPALARRIMLPY